MNKDGSWSDINPSTKYNIALPSFLANQSGPFRHYILEHEVGKKTDYEALKNFIYLNSPISSGLEGRLSVEYPEMKSAGIGIKSPKHLILLWIVFILQPIYS